MRIQQYQLSGTQTLALNVVLAILNSIVLPMRLI